MTAPMFVNPPGEEGKQVANKTGIDPADPLGDLTADDKAKLARLKNDPLREPRRTGIPRQS